MITLSASLTAAQKLAARGPACRVVAKPQRGGLPLFRWTRWYTGAEGDDPTAGLATAAGSLIRIRNDGGTIYTSRVASPTSASTFSSWTSHGAIADSGTGVALAANAAGTEIMLAYSSGGEVMVKTSTDDGVTWGSATSAVNLGGTVEHIGLSYRASGSDACVFYSSGGTVYRTRRASGTWAGAATAWTNSLSDVTGLAVDNDGSDFHLIVTGENASGVQKVHGCAMGDGGLPSNVWSSLNTVAEADAASTVTFSWPAIAMPSLEAHAWFLQTETGDVAAARVMFSRTPASNGANSSNWLDPEPHETDHPYGLSVSTFDGVTAFAVTASGVWHATISGSTDYTSRVLSINARFHAGSSTAIITLNDTDGALADPDDRPHLFPGSAIEISPGYYAAGVAEYGAAYRLTVQKIERRFHQLPSQAPARLPYLGRVTVLHCDGPMEAIARYRAPVAWQTAAGALSRSSVFQRIAAKAGYSVSSSGASSAWSSGQPAFAFSAGENGLSMMQHILSVVADHVRAVDGTLRVTELESGDASVYTYGGAGNHPLLTFATIETVPAVNWVRIVGPDRYVDAVDGADSSAVGNRLRVIRNLDMDSDAKAEAAAAAALRRPLTETITAMATVPVNAGQELYDVVTINDTDRLGTSAQTYRVIGLALDFRRGDRPGSARYTHTLELGEL